MSFKRLEPEDFVISTDSIIAGAFGGTNVPGENPLNSGVSEEYYKVFGGSTSDYFVTIGATQSLELPEADDAIKGMTVYKQFANIIQGDADDEAKGGKGNIANVGANFVAVVVDRSKFRQSIFPNTFEIDGVKPVTSSVEYTSAGRKYAAAGGQYYLYPDIGTALATSGVTAKTKVTGLKVDSEEVLTSNYVFVRARNAEFNYSQNPTFIDKQTGGVRYTDFITAPQTFISTVGLYNDSGDCLAVAKLSKPLKKDFTKEALIRIKLDF